MEIIFENQFLTIFIGDIKAIFQAFLPLVLFLISVTIAFSLLHMIMGLLIRPRRSKMTLF